MDKQEAKALAKSSAKDSKVLRITYLDSKNQPSIRNVEPYEIRGDQLWAYCRKKKGIRQFNLNKIQKAKVTHYTYFPKWPVKMDDGLVKKASSNHEAQLYRIMSSVFGKYEDAELE